jgi:protein-tyrosine phosphatase
MPDRGVPASTQDALALLRTIRAELEAGRNVAVHCRQGIGRSGLIAAGVLVISGVPAGKALEVVSSARGQVVPETPAQVAWVRQLPADRFVEAI